MGRIHKRGKDRKTICNKVMVDIQTTPDWGLTDCRYCLRKHPDPEIRQEFSKSLTKTKQQEKRESREKVREATKEMHKLEDLYELKKEIDRDKSTGYINWWGS